MLAEMNISADLVGLLMDYLKQHQLTQADVYHQLDRYRPASRIPFKQWWSLLQQVQSLLPQRLIGVELGLAIEPRHVGVLGYLTLSCDTVGEALQRFARYQRLLYDSNNAEAIVNGDSVCLRWSSEFGPSSQLSDEVLVMGMLKTVRLMTGDDTLQPCKIGFMFSKPDYHTAFSSYVGCPVVFDQTAVELHFPADYFMLSVTNSDSGLKLLLDQQAQALLAVLPSSDHFYRTLRSAISKAIQAGQPTLDYVACDLAISKRTLHRRLAEKKLSFKPLLQQIRLQLAQQYLLEQKLTLAEIGLLLGYSEQSAFSRAFHRWTGISPRQYQKRKF